MSVAKQASLPAAAPATAGALVDALWRRGLERIVYGVAGLALFILVWRLAYVYGWAPRGTLPDPLSLPSALFQEIEAGRLWPAAQSSLVHYFWGLGIGTFLGIAFGLAAVIGFAVSWFGVRKKPELGVVGLALPLMLFPLALPLLVYASRATSELLFLSGSVPNGSWGFLLLYDWIFALLGYFVFDYVLEE